MAGHRREIRLHRLWIDFAGAGAVARQEVTLDLFENVLIGVDGRQGGRDAIALARRLAARDATFTLVHVCASFPGRGAADPFQIQRGDLLRMLEREREMAGIDAQLVVRGLRPVGRALHEVAEQRRADLLVVGSTRHSVIGRVLIGDDCGASLDGSPCALGVAPRGYALAPHGLERLGVGYDGSPDPLLVLPRRATAGIEDTEPERAARVLITADG